MSLCSQIPAFSSSNDLAFEWLRIVPFLGAPPQWITLRIAHLRIAPWWAILRWAILSTLVIRIAHPNYYVVYALFANDMAIE